MNEYQKTEKNIQEELSKLYDQKRDLDSKKEIYENEQSTIQEQLLNDKLILKKYKEEASNFKPKALNYGYKEKKQVKLFNLLISLLTLLYCIMAMGSTMLIGILTNDALIGIFVCIGIMYTGKFVYEKFSIQINDILNKFLSKIIQNKINKVKNNEQGKKYYDICKKIEGKEETITRLEENLEKNNTKLSELFLEISIILESIKEIEEDLYPKNDTIKKETYTKKKIK